MVDFEAMNNFISQQTIERLSLIPQQVARTLQVYMTDDSHAIVDKQIHMEATILEDPQELTLDVMDLKYDAILEMP